MGLRPQRILDYREYPVLYVDDEPENLRIFELGFRRDFQILTASSGDQALELLHEHPIAVVLSDQRMPGMTGVELLARVRRLDTRIMRVLVTAYGDAEILSAAINDGSIFKYVPKPWTPEDMAQAVRRAIEMYALDRERSELLREVTTLNRVSHSINKQLDLDRLLRLLLTTVTEDLGYDAATLLFFDAGEERLRFAMAAPEGEPVEPWLRGLDIGTDEARHFFKALQEGESTILTLSQLFDYESAIRAWLTEVAAEECLVVPLVTSEGAIGALAIDNRRGGGSFSVSDRTLIEGLAAQAVVAIQNARLVDDLRRSREQVVRADRLGTLGTLAAGLAHEINNPLTSIRTFLSLAPEKRYEEDDEFWSAYHQLATSEVDRIRGLVASMERLASGGSGDEEPEWCEPAPMAEGAARLLGQEAEREGVRLELEREDDVPRLFAVRAQVHQVLLNLILNAIHASRGREEGCVVVRVLRDAQDGDEGVVFEVADNGAGIAPEALERLFDPFFTTKGPDQGTGLGLAICQQLTANHDGSIEVRTREGEGATFRVHLPVGSERAAA
jgi:signal transduction histidine kinase/CheY-like chemotaxis protein